MLETISIVVGIGVLILLFKPFFDDLEGFFSCVLFWLTPDIFSLARGRWGEDILSEMKLFVWLACGGCVSYFLYRGLLTLFS